MVGLVVRHTVQARVGEKMLLPTSPAAGLWSPDTPSNSLTLCAGVRVYACVSYHSDQCVSVCVRLGLHANENLDIRQDKDNSDAFSLIASNPNPSPARPFSLVTLPPAPPSHHIFVSLSSHSSCLVPAGQPCVCARACE